MTAYRKALQVCLVLTACCGGQALAADKPDKVSFYFAAHEDDWQLFMNPSAFQDVLGAAGKTVFVYVTAGDAGLGTGDGGRKRPYYLVRAVRAIVDAERGGASLVQVNVAETDPAINPDDHADHLMTAQAALDAVKDLSCVRRVSYVDYASAKLP